MSSARHTTQEDQQLSPCHPRSYRHLSVGINEALLAAKEHCPSITDELTELDISVNEFATEMLDQIAIIARQFSIPSRQLDELLSDSITEFIRCLPSYRKTGSLAGFCIRCVENYLIKTLNNETKKQRGEVELDETNINVLATEEELKSVEDRVLLVEIMDLLTGQDRDMIILSSQGYDQEAIAGILGCSKAAINSRATRLRKWALQRFGHSSW